MSSLPGEALSSACVAASESLDDQHREAGGLGDQGLQGHVGPAEVGGGAHGAVAVDEAGGADADAEHGVGGAGDGGEHQLDDDRGVDAAALGGVDGGGALLAHDDLAGDVEHRGPQPGRHRQVDGEGEQAAAVEVDQGGPLAGTALLGGADVEHAALVDELGDQVRHGHLGDPDLAGQLGPAGGPEAAQGLQHEREVLAPAIRGEDCCRGPHAARHCAGHEG